MKKILAVLGLAAFGLVLTVASAHAATRFEGCDAMAQAAQRITNARDNGWSYESAIKDIDDNTKPGSVERQWGHSTVRTLWDYPAITPTVAYAYTFKGCMKD